MVEGSFKRGDREIRWLGGEFGTSLSCRCGNAIIIIIIWQRVTWIIYIIYV